MLTLRPPAKINWFLDVYGKRPDGYHEIRSFMQCVTLFDTLVLEDSDHIEVQTDADISREENLVYRAATLLRDETATRSGAKITLRKSIPLAAGLGGGSSNAAYALRGLNRLWDLNLSSSDLSDLGRRLGSDVPFFLQDGAALVSGRGEIVSPVRMEKAYPVLLVKPVTGISAGWAYQRLESLREGHVLTKKKRDIKLFFQALEDGDFPFLRFHLRNDLERPAVERFEVIGEIKRSLMARGALVSLMSGSGPTVFGIFATAEEAMRATDSLGSFWWRVVQTVTGPAA